MTRRLGAIFPIHKTPVVSPFFATLQLPCAGLLLLQPEFRNYFLFWSLSSFFFILSFSWPPGGCLPAGRGNSSSVPGFPVSSGSRPKAFQRTEPVRLPSAFQEKCCCYRKVCFYFSYFYYESVNILHARLGTVLPGRPGRTGPRFLPPQSRDQLLLRPRPCFGDENF